MEESNHGSSCKTNKENIVLIAKWGKERVVLNNLQMSNTVAELKEMLKEKTQVLPKRQKIIGLQLNKTKNISSKTLCDGTKLSDIKLKKKREDPNQIQHEFILMGTPEESIFIDPSEKEDLPIVVDDFDFDFNAGSDEWIQHRANGENLKKFTESTKVHVMNEPRDGKPLLVLDLDHTLLDFSSKRLQRTTSSEESASTVASMKRPFMDQFLSTTYRFYDLVVWSQTSWRWLETKLTELGMLTNPEYKFCFVLDKTSMFSVRSTKRNGESYNHHVKPLQIIWSKFPQWGPHNTVHLDDLSRNFALNLGSGLKVSAYHRKKSSASKDTELYGLSIYLEKLALEAPDFNLVKFQVWQDVVKGKAKLKMDEDGKI